MRTLLLVPLAALTAAPSADAPDRPPWSDWSDRLDELDGFRLVYTVRPEDPDAPKLLTLCYEAPDRLICSMGASADEALPFGRIEGSAMTLTLGSPDEGRFGAIDCEDALERAADWLDSTRAVVDDEVVDAYDLRSFLTLNIRHDAETGQLDISPNLSFNAEGREAPFGWIERLEALEEGAERVDAGWTVEADEALYTLDAETGLILDITNDEGEPLLVLQSMDLDPELDDALFEIDGEIEDLEESDMAGLALLPFFVARIVTLEHLFEAVDDGLEPDDTDWATWAELFSDYYAASGAPERSEALYDPLCESIDEWIESVREQIEERGDDPEFTRELGAAFADVPRQIVRQTAGALSSLVRNQYQPGEMDRWSEETQEAAFDVEMAAVMNACHESLVSPILEYLSDQVATLE